MDADTDTAEPTSAQLRELIRQQHYDAVDLYSAWYQRQSIPDEELH